MTTLGALPRAAAANGLSSRGLPIAVGPYVFRVRGQYPSWIDHLRALYADFPILPEPAIAHFHISVVRERPWYRIARHGANVTIDGFAPFVPSRPGLAMTMFELLLNYVIAGTAQQHLVIHAAVVERGGRAAILPAPSGSGKSTLCAALVADGWRLLSDEFAVVTFDDGRLLPCPRPISLKNDSIPRIRQLLPDAEFSPLFEGTIRGTIAYVKPPVDAVARMAEPAMPAVIIMPRFGAGAPLSVEPMDRALGFARMIASSMNYRLLGRDGFDAMVRLVDRCRLFALSYGDTRAAVDAVARLHAELT